MPRPRIPDRRERLLDAAEELVLEHGFDAMTVAAVAARAGVAKGAVYLEIESKHGLLEAVLIRAFGRAEARVAQRVGDDDRLSTAYVAAVEALLAEPVLVAAFLDDTAVLGSFVQTSSTTRYRDRHLQVQGWVRALHAQGRLDPEVDADALALALSSATLGLLSAARVLGPLTADQLGAGIAALGTMVRQLER
jgi:AcrR family transcriptional regulator